MPVKRKIRSTDKFLISSFSFFTFPGISWVKRMVRGVPALKNRNCRRYFFGQFISNIGSWMQIVTLSWVVFQITQSAFWVGVTAACSSLPALFFSLFGGSIVDSFPKKKVVFWTNFIGMVQAFILGILTLYGLANLPVIIFMSIFQGIIQSVYTPAHFSFISEIADQESLTSAMSINASVSSLGRILGPVVAGIYLKLAGPGGAFILNGLSYIAVLLAIYLTKVPSKIINKHLKPLKAIKEGLVYTFHHPMIRSVIGYVGAASIFAWSYTTIMPVIASDVFHTDASGMSYLYTAIGIGGLAATLLAAYLSNKVSKLILFVSGNSLFSITLFLFTYTTSLNLGIFYIFLSGLGLVLINIVLGTMVQHLADPSFRGRVSSIYFVVYGGILFLGNLEIGYLAEKLGAQMALRINTSIMLLVGLFVILIRERLRSAQKEYNESLIHH